MEGETTSSDGKLKPRFCNFALERRKKYRTNRIKTENQSNPIDHFVFLVSADSYFGGDESGKKKIKRVRTAFTEDQLEVLQRNFDVDSNPDGQDLERIAANAGLSKRVTQVWFQNARARQKKHSYLGKRKAPYELNVHLQTNLLL